MIIFRLSLLLPILICLYILISLFKSNGNILSGFNTLDEEKKLALIRLGYLERVKLMVFLMILTLVLGLFLSFFVNAKYVDIVYVITWVVFFAIIVLGILFINLWIYIKTRF